MEATGAMALGPSMKRASMPSWPALIAAATVMSSLAEGRGGGGGSGVGSSAATRARVGPTENIDFEDASDSDDAENKGHFDYQDDSDSDDYGGTNRSKRRPRQLKDIWRESDMAPIVVPTEGDAPRRFRRLDDDLRHASTVKTDPHEHEANMRAALDGISAVPAAAIERTLAEKEAAARLEVAEYLLEHKGTTEPIINILQFPREFPEFRRREPDAPVDANGFGEMDEDIKPDIKPEPVEGKLEALPASAAERYLLSGWEGWGKRATRKGRPPMGGTSGHSGPIGKVQIMASGKVRIVMGSEERGNLLVYDVRAGWSWLDADHCRSCPARSRSSSSTSPRSRRPRRRISTASTGRATRRWTSTTRTTSSRPSTSRRVCFSGLARLLRPVARLTPQCTASSSRGPTSIACSPT